MPDGPQPDSTTTTASTVDPSPKELAAHDKPRRSGRKWVVLALLAIALGAGIYYVWPSIRLAFDTVSTDDAYVNGHVTFLAPRVAGQVAEVLVDDNMRVKRGDILVRLDREPYQVKLAIREASVVAAEAGLAAAQATVRGEAAQARANRFRLEHAIEEVNSKVADLKSAVASLRSQEASLNLAQANLKRGEQLLPGGGISKEDVDIRRRSVQVDQANVDQAVQSVAAIRVGLGLSSKPKDGDDLAAVPDDLVQNYSSVRQALGDLMASAAALGFVPKSWDLTPDEAIAHFHSLDPDGDIDRIYEKLLPNAPEIKVAEAKLLQAKSDLDQARLDLRYCDIVSEIDGVVTRRNVNPGNNVQVGQGLMAIRSLTEIWVDANFKETQLGDLRIGQRVLVKVDMYGKSEELGGRITGFTMGTGQTLSLLPPQNATGNFVKIVQRLPVRIEFDDHDPDETPLFVGLSVVPHVFVKEPPTGPHAGERLQPFRTLPSGPTAGGASSE